MIRCVKHKENVYVIGGRSNEDPSKFFSLNLLTSKWSQLSPMPNPRAFLAAGIYQHMIVAIGGDTNKTELYDIHKDSWTSAAPLQHSRSGLLGVTVNINKKCFIFLTECKD